MLTAKDILKCNDTADLRRVDVPEWGGEVYVKVMSGAERDKWELSTTELLKNPSAANIRASLCLITICDDKGKRLFDDAQLIELGKKSSIVLERIFNISREINRLRDEDIEELEKNLAAGRPGDSGSSLQAI